MTEQPQSDGVERIDLSDAIRSVCFRPKRFFKRLGKRRVQFPWLLVLLGFASSATGLGVIAALDGGGWRDMIGWAVVMVSFMVVFGLPLFFAAAGVTHLAVRLLGGQAGFWKTANVLAYASAPYVFGVVPFVGLLAGLWAAVLGVVGISKVHELGNFRALVAGAMPTVLGVVVSVLLKGFVIEGFQMPSESMFPTLRVRDHFFVEKLAYGSRSMPPRGEAIAFELPYAPVDAAPQTYVKRVAGVGGDTVSVEEGHLIVNGWRAPTCRVGSMRMPASGAEVEVFVEFLDGRAYLIAIEPTRGDATQGPYKVSSGELFVIGDNRNNSADSRSWRGGRGGGVPIANLVGSVWSFWYPFSRIGEAVDKPVLPPEAPELAAALAACLKAAPKSEQTQPPPLSAH